jgi:hypothetical protein
MIWHVRPAATRRRRCRVCAPCCRRLLCGDYKQSEYGKVILPFTVLRRLDCVLEPTKAEVLAEKASREKAGLNPEPFLLRKSGQFFYNTSPIDLKKLMGDQDHIGENLRAYMQAFSPAVRDIFESFESWRVYSPPLAAFPCKANVSEPYGFAGIRYPAPWASRSSKELPSQV